MNIVKEFAIPTAILTAICVVAAGALVWVYGLTQPIIDQRLISIQNDAMREVLSGADAFTVVEPSDMPAGVASISKANNGSGVAVSVQAKGYSSTPVQLMVGIKSDGTIEKIQVVKAEETPDIGTRALTDDYLAQFVGKSATTYEGVDGVAGATITSGAVKSNLKSAFNGYALATGGAAIAEPEKGLTDALIAQHYPGTTPESVSVNEAGIEVLICGDAGYIITAGENGYGGELRVAVLFDAEGAVLWSVVTESSETPSIGDKVESDDYTQRFVGKTNADNVDIIAGSTLSSTAYKAAVDKAAAVFEAIKGA